MKLNKEISRYTDMYYVHSKSHPYRFINTRVTETEVRVKRVRWVRSIKWVRSVKIRYINFSHLNNLFRYIRISRPQTPEQSFLLYVFISLWMSIFSLFHTFQSFFILLLLFVLVNVEFYFINTYVRVVLCFSKIDFAPFIKKK